MLCVSSDGLVIAVEKISLLDEKQYEVFPERRWLCRAFSVSHLQPSCINVCEYQSPGPRVKTNLRLSAVVDRRSPTMSGDGASATTTIVVPSSDEVAPEVDTSTGAALATADEDAGPPKLPVENEDETTDEELRSWYLYDIANSVYSAPAMAMLNNLQHIGLATWNGCNNVKEETNGAVQCDSKGELPDNSDRELETDIGLRPSSVTFLVIALSVFFQAIAYISLSAYADYGKNKKLLLRRTCMAGCLCGSLFAFCVDPALWWVVSLLIVFTGVFHGLSIVYYNAYLPLMVRNHPEYKLVAQQEVEKQQSTGVKTSQEREEDDSTLAKDESGTKNVEATSSSVLTEERLSSEFSNRGFAYGYVSSAIACVLVAGILFATGPEKDSSRDTYKDRFGFVVLGACSLLCALFWLGAGLRSAAGLKDREGPELQTSEEWAETMGGAHVRVTAWTAVRFSWRRTYRALVLLFRPENRNMCRFMMAYFLFSDGYSTIANAGIIYAQVDLKIATMWLGVILVEVVFFNFVGVKFFHWLFSGNPAKGKPAVRAKVAMQILLVLYMISSVIAFFTLHLGLPALLFFGFAHGMLLGTCQSYSRVLFSSLVPKGLEAQMFALYEISDKGSSWIGPTVLAIIAQFTSVRYGFFWVFLAFFIGFLLLHPLNLDETSQQRNQNFELDAGAHEWEKRTSTRSSSRVGNAKLRSEASTQSGIDYTPQKDKEPA
ncbi:unnamed protein product [Amoebophrya sp. A120]|nr:unnamed protein product [Amoebophrya sp. A120]|eukprot:GSA120T00002454001.1